MTRTNAVKIERRLRARGVYKPYVTCTDGVIEVESYPLTVRVTQGACDPEMGPAECLKLTDSTLPAGDKVVSTCRIFIGQDLEQAIARLLIDFHAPAYERAMEQESVSTDPMDAKEFDMA